MATILDGKTLSKKIRDGLKNEVAGMADKPGLAVVLVGGDPASQLYVNSKEKACQEIGFYSEKVLLSEDISEKELFAVLDQLNNDPKIHGILVQFPLPKRLQYLEEKILNFINPLKDVDGFHPLNVGALASAKGDIPENLLVPCTPKGVIRLLKEYGYGIRGKRAVVCGRSNLVGKPVGFLLLGEGATVTFCHSCTQNLPAVSKEADILVAAIGKPRFITADFIKPGAVVIDVGINREGKKVVGDVDFEAVREIAEAITPVPGGVGPMTIAMLMENVLMAYRNQNLNKNEK